MTIDEQEEIRHILSAELHHIDEAHGLKKVERLITFIGLALMIAAVIVGLDMWSPVPPVAAEVIKAMRS